MSYITTIELQREQMKFSVGHFTIFSETERERLHGHNYTMCLAITAEIVDNGISFDYRYYKRKSYELCRELNQSVLLPTASPYMTIERDENYLYALFNGERIPFIEGDVTLLPISNICVEELSRWFIEKLMEDQDEINQHRILKLHVKVFSGPGQSGSCTWRRTNV